MRIIICQLSLSSERFKSWGTSEIIAMKIQIVDLFAGPGGLGEGFSSFVQNNVHPFEIAISIEKDSFAHQTLALRSFFRKFKSAPEEYYKYLRGEITKEYLFEQFPNESKLAQIEALQVELGNSNKYSHSSIIEKIRSQLNAELPCVVIGGPPCQAYSLVGRSRMGKMAKFSSDARHTLYLEYLKIINEIKPQVFVMENVKGILSSKLNGELIFPKILKDLESPSAAISGEAAKNSEYRLYSLNEELLSNGSPNFLIKSEEYGIPQRRHRVIIVGVRSDLECVPGALKRATRRFTVEDAIGDLPRLRAGISKAEDSLEAWCDLLGEALRPSANSRPLNRGAAFIRASKHNSPATNGLIEQLMDDRIVGTIDHVTRAHIKNDILRYKFLSKLADMTGTSVKIEQLPKELLPNHKNVEMAINSKSLFNDRFRVQLRNQPSTTITSHISKDGHYFIHYDWRQARSLTVREAARLQTFPDNYKFEGPRTSQYQQVGNAVPPLLAKQIAKKIHQLISKIPNLEA